MQPKKEGKYSWSQTCVTRLPNLEYYGLIIKWMEIESGAQGVSLLSIRFFVWFHRKCFNLNSFAFDN